MEFTQRTFDVTKVTGRIHYVNAQIIITDHQGQVYLIQRTATPNPPKLEDAQRAIKLCGMSAVGSKWVLLGEFWALRLKERNREKGNNSVLVDNGRPFAGSTRRPI